MFELARFAAHRPWLFHATHQSNLNLIQKARCLQSATQLLQQAGLPNLVGVQRIKPLDLLSGHVLTDQQPLHQQNIALEPGWSFRQLLELLNSHVFFWPGHAAEQPIAHGQRYLARYQNRPTALLRVPFDELIRLMPSPLFCPYNSGSPRWAHGQPSPRGPNTFVSHNHPTIRVSRVVEVVWPDSVRLPDSTEVCLIGGANSAWQSL